MFKMLINLFERIFIIKKINIMTKEELISILDYSREQCVTEKEAAKRLGYNNIHLWYYKKKYGVQTNPMGKATYTYRITRKYCVNDNFFKQLSDLNCYYGGFLAADGCVYQDNKTLVLMLSEKDSQLINEFKSNLGFQGNVYKAEDKYGHKFCRISITSPEIVNDLNKQFNITPKKSLTLMPPNITDEHLIDCFICGYIDGDGSISLAHNKKTQDYIRISVIGTIDVCEWIKKRFSKIVNKSVGSIVKKGNIYIYSVTNHTARNIFLHYYTLQVPKLERKWSSDKYMHCLEYKKKLPICRRKGVYVYNLKGELLKYFDTLKEASEYTNISQGRISNLCKINDNRHKAGDYMFNRNGGVMKPFAATYSLNKKYI